MLPFHKRTNRSDDFEDLHTGDVMEVVAPGRAQSTNRPESNARSASIPAPPPSHSSRPRAGLRDMSMTDEVTALMPAKTFSTLLPPPPSRSVRPPSLAPVQTFRPQPPQHQGFVQQQLDGESTRTDYRTLPPPSFPPPGLVPSEMSAMPQGIPQGMMRTIPPAPSSFAPVAYSMSPGKSDSDGRIIDPPGTVITTRTKVLTGRPTLSWGAALVAMGIFGGLVTAVLARGDGDALVDATASFVDPAHASKAAAAPAPAEVKIAAATPMLETPPVVAPVVAPAPPELGVIGPTPMPDPIAAVEPAAAKPAAASMAYAAPAHAAAKVEPKTEAPKAAPAAAAPVKVAAAKPIWTAPPRPAPTAAEKAEKAEKAATAKAEKAEKKGAATKDDLASAKEAKALADAQLEASLR